MKKTRAFCWLYVLLAGLLFSSSAFAQTVKQPAKEKQKGSAPAEEKEETAREQRLSGQAVQSAQTVEQQRAYYEHRMRATFPVMSFTVKNPVIQVGEPVELEFKLRNGAIRTYWVDRRKRLPIFEILDMKGKVLQSTRPKVEEVAHPTDKDLIPLAPRKSMTIFKGKGPIVNAPGQYYIRAIYAFYEPEPFDKWARRSWYGTLVPGEALFEVRKK